MSTEVKNLPQTESAIINTRMNPSTFRTRNSELGTQNSAFSARKVAEEFASLLLMEMLKSMRATLSGEGLDGETTSARDTYAALADVEVTRTLAKRDDMRLVHFFEQPLARMVKVAGAQEPSSTSDEEEGLKEF